MRLGCRQEILLREAARRFMKFNDRNQSITTMWTGLGTATKYNSVCPKYMVVATGSNYGHSIWWKLTSAGAKIVQKMIDDGLTVE